MDDSSFKKMDEAWMRRMKPLHKNAVKPEHLKGFSDSVIERIRDEQAPLTEKAPRRVFLPVPARVWGPVFAVLLLAVVTVLGLPGKDFPSVSDKLVTLTSTGVSNVSDEIEILAELGELDDEDAPLEDLELVS